MNLMITADRIGEASGGGLVVTNEAEALKQLGPCEVYDGSKLGNQPNDPWGYDARVFQLLTTTLFLEPFKLSHFYAGTFSDTVRGLKSNGIKVTYTAAAHDIKVSREEHEKLGLAYHYPHLTQPEQFERYVRGYLEADVLVCPSKHSAGVMRGFGAKNRIEIIPHGCCLPKEIKPFPKTFTVGYLGAAGPDKGLRYLLEAWKKLNYKDAILKIGGRDATSPFMLSLVERFGGGSIYLAGWQDAVEDFYGSVSVYCQPSASEGFSCEVIEAMANGRPVLCSDGAGACDRVPPEWIFPARNADALAEKIDGVRRDGDLQGPGFIAHEHAKYFTWDKIRARYVKLWKELLQ